jgi:hypothetical protein
LFNKHGRELGNRSYFIDAIQYLGGHDKNLFLYISI